MTMIAQNHKIWTHCLDDIHWRQWEKTLQLLRDVREILKELMCDWMIIKWGKQSRIYCSCFSQPGKCLPNYGAKVTNWRERLTCHWGSLKVLTQGEVKSDTRQFYSDAEDITEWLGDYLIVGTFINNSQVLPYGGLFISNYWVDREGEPVASKYLLLLKAYTERRASFDIR